MFFQLQNISDDYNTAIETFITSAPNDLTVKYLKIAKWNLEIVCSYVDGARNILKFENLEQKQAQIFKETITQGIKNAIKNYNENIRDARLHSEDPFIHTLYIESKWMLDLIE